MVFLIHYERLASEFRCKITHIKTDERFNRLIKSCISPGWKNEVSTWGSALVKVLWGHLEYCFYFFIKNQGEPIAL